MGIGDGLGMARNGGAAASVETAAAANGDDGRAAVGAHAGDVATPVLKVLVVSPSSELRISTVAMLRLAGHKVSCAIESAGARGRVELRVETLIFFSNSQPAPPPQKKKTEVSVRRHHFSRPQGPGRQAGPGELGLRLGAQRARSSHGVGATILGGAAEK